MRVQILMSYWLCLSIAGLIGHVSSWAALADSDIQLGQKIYERSCVTCHGEFGKGDGPAAFYNSAYSAPRPRDFTVGNYKFRSTPSGEAPTDQDIFRVLTNGIPGYMPSFSGLSEDQRWQVTAYLKQFSPDLFRESPTVVDLPDPFIPFSLKSAQQGRSVYLEMECQACHGLDGRGTGATTLMNDLADSRGLQISSTDLTFPQSFKNGGTGQDIIRTVLTGLDGTPMPSYEAQLQGRSEDAWHLVNYVLSLSPTH